MPLHHELLRKLTFSRTQHGLDRAVGATPPLYKRSIVIGKIAFFSIELVPRRLFHGNLRKRSRHIVVIFPLAKSLRSGVGDR
jgi:hypothetical protein